MTGEFELIARHFKRPARSAEVRIGIGDDAAALTPAPGATLLVTTDTLVVGRHFRPEVPADALGWKAAMVNLSDLAAMGGTPRWLTLALTLPEADDAWVAAFADGFRAAAEQVEAELVGGDITRGPLTIGVTALGETLDAPLTRGAAQAGDQLWLTGTTGQAAAAVAGLAAGVTPDASLLTRLDRPQARCAAGRAARGLAHAAIDVSDGVLADLDHLLQASRLGARLDADALRPTAAMQALADSLGEAPAPWIWTGGDDYELLVAVPPERAQTLASIWAEQGLAPLCIGELVDAPGLQWQGDAPTIDPVSSGFRHF